MLIVFDTNIWKSNLYLRSPMASAVKAYLNANNATIGMPEVVELEIKRHLLYDLTTYRDSVRSSYERLLAIFGRLKEVSLPSDEEIKNLVESTIDGIGLPLRRVPFSKEAAYASFVRTIEKRRPSHRNQQFKDCVLWQDCKGLAKEEKVILVSNDNAFFKNDDPREGLDPELANEIAEDSIDLQVFSSLFQLLPEIRTKIEVPVDQLQDDLEKQVGEQFNRMPEKNGFRREILSEFDVKHFATENPSVLFVEVTGTYPCKDTSDSKRPRALLSFTCDGSFHILEKKFLGLRPLELELAYRDEDGLEHIKKAGFLRAAGMVIGHKTVEHQVRYDLTK